MRKRKKGCRVRNDTSRKHVEFRDKVIFEFECEGVKYKNNTGRIKISEEGYFNFLIKQESKWKNVKGVLKKLKLVKERKPVGFTKGSA